ncbi:GNAT family N-acetyltransferase [Undibacterium sp. TS12]|uniref:GNAT family N-acetyltransferase n=1 Tax=Undibacterium sp. TS12 TaxID=2908202 RepID=UPI001F4CB08F|nr:GNAT family N-acetyltransferase [Undibacterium sp. TS12]MCH8622849.1 GNAT family N-acetyltransferase [Undibacterium sp. TS12]
MQITYLADHLHHIPILANWQHEQFSYLAPAVSLEQRMEKLTASAQKQGMPLSFIAVDNDKLLGSASLLQKTITHPHLSPWLSAVYVTPAHRRQGIATALTQHVVQAAASMGVRQLYLFTPDKAAMYARLGWQVLEHGEHLGRRITIMSITCSHLTGG